MVTQVHNLEDLIASLLDCSSTYSTVDLVTNQVTDSLKTIGEHQPNTLLTASHHYLLQNPKLSATSKAFVLRVLNDVVSHSGVVSKLDEQLVLLIINLATQEMTMTVKGGENDWADAASEILVTLAKTDRFASHVIDAVLQKFPPGLNTSPHKHIVLTLTTIAQHNPFGLLPFLTDILSRTAPILQYVKVDPLRSAWARAICAFCEAIRECQTERPKEAIEYDPGPTCDSPSPRSQNDVLDMSAKATYSDQAEAIYDVVFQWMYSKEAKTRADAAECVGELCVIIRPSKILEDLKKLVTTIIGLYKKAYSEQHTITVAVCRFLEATCNDDLCPLDPYLEDILNALFPNACLDVDDSSLSLNPNAIKNHSEAFRCFHVAAARFADRIVYYLLHKMQNAADMNKLGAINVLRHLLNSSGVHMEDKRSLVMMGLKKLLAAEQHASIRVKRAIVQLCVALSDHAYVDAEGGDHVIAFLVRNLVPPTDQEIAAKKMETDIAGSNQLRTQCAQALHTIATTCVCASKLLWPYLFEFICSERYTPVVGDICKCLRIIVAREAEAGGELDFDTGFENAKVAGKHAVMSRLVVVMCNAPLNGLISRRAKEALILMTSISTWFHPSIPEVMQRWYPKMDALLDELCNAQVASPTTDSPVVELRGRRVARWNDAVLDLLAACITVVVDGEWRTDLTSSFTKQLDIYKDMADEKAFALRCIGTSLSKIASTTFVTDHILQMFKATQHSVAAERQGCARGVAACATVHTNLILIELENVSKWEHARKSSGFFGFIKDAMPMRPYSDVEMVYLRATLMLSYGHVVMACPVDTLIQRLNANIIVFLRLYLANSKQETVVREALLETMRLIALAVQPKRLGAEYRFEARNELLTYIKDYVQTENPETLSSSIRLLAAKATAALVRLEPVLNDNDIRDVTQVLTQSILPMCREKSGLKTLAYDLFDYASTSISALTSDSPIHSHRKIDDDESATIMEATFVQYGAALEAVIAMKPNVNTVTILLKMLQPYYGRLAEHERQRAIDATVLVLRVYLQYAEDICIGRATDFSPLASLLARLTPRLADSLAHVRLQALAAINWTLRLAHVHKGHGRDTEHGIFSMDRFIRDHLSEDGRLDGQTAKKTIKDMSSVVEASLPTSQMQMYLSGLFDMLTDRQSQVSSSAAQLLTYSLETRGTSLLAEADTLVSMLLKKLPEVNSCVQTYTDLLSALVAFAAHQTQAVCDVLIREPLPYPIHISDAWGCLSRDRTLFTHILDYLLELITGSLDAPYDVMDTGAGNSVKIAHTEPCQYSAAIVEIVKSGDPEWVLNERIPALLSAFFHLICSVSDCQFPVVQKENKDGTKHPLIITPELRRAVEKPAGMGVNAIMGILSRVRCHQIIEEMNQARGWTECLDRDQFIAALSQLMRSICEHRPDWVAGIWTSVSERAEAESEPIRLAAVIVASSLIRKCPDAHGAFNEPLLVKAVRLLQNELSDQSLRIRKLCVRGLGELADCSSPTVTERFANMAVEAAMGGLDDLGDRRDTVAMESIIALSKLVSRTDNKQLLNILPQVLLKIRPCFEKESAALRAAAFTLFGELGARVGSSCSDFSNHLHTNIVTILLHLNDEHDDVKKTCALALYRLHGLLGCSQASVLIEEELTEGRLPVSYHGTVKDLAAILALSFPDKVNQYALTCSNYFKSSSSKMRANSAFLTGSLLCVLTPKLRGTISKELIFTGLVLLLKDPEDVLVRVAAARAIALLHDFS